MATKLKRFVLERLEGRVGLDRRKLEVGDMNTVVNFARQTYQHKHPFRVKAENGDWRDFDADGRRRERRSV